MQPVWRGGEDQRQKTSPCGVHSTSVTRLHTKKARVDCDWARQTPTHSTDTHSTDRAQTLTAQTAHTHTTRRDRQRRGSAPQHGDERENGERDAEREHKHDFGRRGDLFGSRRRPGTGTGSRDGRGETAEKRRRGGGGGDWVRAEKTEEVMRREEG
jgi:hypothetical protein